MSGAVTSGVPPLPDSRKLIQVNRVDRASTNADGIRIDWALRDLPAPATVRTRTHTHQRAGTGERLFPSDRRTGGHRILFKGRTPPARA